MTSAGRRRILATEPGSGRVAGSVQKHACVSDNVEEEIKQLREEKKKVAAKRAT